MTIRLHKDLSYGDYPRQKYDLYVPSRYDAAVVYLYGGGWEDGDKSWDGIQKFNFLAQNKLLVAVPNYRLVGNVSQISEELRGDGRYPNNIQDVQQFLNQFCPKVPLCLVGDCAGGHLAMLSLFGLDRLPVGVVNINAPLDLCVNPTNPITVEGQRLINAYTRGKKENIVKASPAHRLLEYEQLLEKTNTRFYFWRNSQDPLTLPSMATGFIAWAKTFLGNSRVKEVVVEQWCKDHLHGISLTDEQKRNLILDGVNFILERDNYVFSN